jgi:N-acetylneuraminic acid mutarotase
MSGSSTVTGFWGQAGVYGTLGQPAAANVPAGRYGASGWTDSSGNLWLFGGWGCESGATNGFPSTCDYNDLWEFNLTTVQWVWMGGSNTTDEPGVYGSLGKPATTNIPGSREYAVSWTDSKGNFWLFGGYGFDSVGMLGYLNDLWEFSISTNQWTWVGGTDLAYGNGVYGTLGASAVANVPGSRSGSVAWTDNNGNLWLFGGYGVASNGGVGYLNDLWQFNTFTGDWTWMAGSSTLGGNGGQPGTYATWMTPNSSNVPGSRQYATAWTDAAGNLWLFGGYGYDSAAAFGYMNDLWEFNPSTNEWAWMGGNETLIERSNGELGLPGVYGTLNIPSLANTPGGRDGAVSWTDSKGNLWLLGGYGYDSSGTLGYFNDLWEFQPSAAGLSPASAPTFSPGTGTFYAGQTVTITDATPGAVVYYLANGSPSAVEYTGPITISATETIEALATPPGYANSAVTSAAYTIPVAATPTFSPGPGTYSTAQRVSISDATAGAIFYYTTNGTTPTTSSTQYTGPITVSSSETIEVIAVVPGYTNSAVASAIYTIWSASAVNEWAWMGGTGANSIYGVWGLLGIAAPGNLPGSREDAASWTDTQGNSWLFGGYGIDAAGNFDVLLNDLWEFSPATNEWTWMAGSSVAGSHAICWSGGCGQPGVYGPLGVPSAANIPGARDFATTWTDGSGHFWLFGGSGYDAQGNGGLLNDLWELNPSTLAWTWVGGGNSVGTEGGQSGLYGTLGTPSAANIPAARVAAVAWVDKAGHVWLFGGDGIVQPFDSGAYNDLWEYDPSSNEWTWMGGNNSACDYGVQSGVWGSMGAAAAGNIPSCRYGASGWTDRNGNLWLFGGQGRDIQGFWGDLNSLWEFNPATGQWAWTGGNNIIGLPGGDLPGVYGTKGTPAAGNIPSSRWGTASWTDASGNSWLFGGLENGFEGDSGVSPLNDLWAFNPSANEWAWMGGSGASFPPYSGVYGTQGTPAPGNFPGSRSAASSWTDSQGNLWLYGGDGFDAGLYLNILNDVWKYVPSAPAPVPGFAVVDLNDQAYNNAESFVIQAGTSGGTTINTVVSDGFSGTISLSAVNLPTGITVSFSPASVTGFAVTQATFAVGLNVTPGNYTITVAGTSGGVTETTTVSLTVGSAPPPTFTFGASPSSLTVNSASQGLVTLTLTPQYGFNSAVSFACSGLPTNATCSFSPTTVTPSGSAATTQLTISVSAQATAVRPDSHPFLPATGLAFVVSLFVCKRRRVLGGALVALVIAGVGLISGCGGGSAAGGGGGVPQNPVTYSVTVTATSDTVMRTTAVTLTVN